MKNWLNTLNPLSKSTCRTSRAICKRQKQRRLLKLEGLEHRRYLAGDLWTQRGGDAGHDNYVDTTIDVSQLNHQWTAANPNSQNWSYDLAISEQHVYRTEYVGSNTGGFGNFRVVARDINTGNEVWSTQISSYAHEGVSEPSYANGIVYVNASGHSGISGGNDSQIPKLYGLNASTGAIVLIQRYAAQWGSGERPVLSNNRLIVEDGYYGGISSYQASTLTRQWFVGRSAAYDPPYAAVDDSYAYAFGKEVYNLATGARTFINHPVQLYSPTVSNSGRVIYSNSNNGISAFDGDTHQHLWSTNGVQNGQFASMAVGNGLIALTGNNGLQIFRESDGVQIGTWNDPENLTTSKLILTNTHVFVQSLNSGKIATKITAVNLATLTEDWRYEHRFPPGYYIHMGMSMIDGRLVLTHELFTKMFKVGAPNNAPVAGNDSVSINEDTTTTINVIANDTDLDGHSLAVLSTSSPSNGSVILNANQTITYTPNLNFFGSDSFSYEVGDGRGGTAIGTVQISVNSVNDRPVASPQTFTVSEDVALNGQLTGADADGDSLTFQLVTGTTQGTVQFNNATGEFTYNPRANYFGADGFTFKVKDGFLDSEVVSVTIAVESVNDIPIAAPLSIQIDEDGIAEGQLSAEDVDNAILSFVGSSPSPGGSLEVASDGRFTYRPPQNFNGVASFSFQASDGLLMSLPASVTVTVRPVNDAPSLSEATFVIAENLPNGSQVGLVQATDIDSQILTYSISGTDAAPFIINSQTGALSVANSALLDYERQTDFVFFATVTDDLGAATSKLVRVRLTNLVDVQMDVLPGDSSNTINLASKEIEVALLGSYEFNPATIDLSSVRLQGPASSTGSAIVRSGKNGYKTRFVDVNNDGILDLVMAFNTNNTGLKVGDTFVKLTGIRATATGPVDFELTQTVRVINRRR